jgi:hypothetical protein
MEDITILKNPASIWGQVNEIIINLKKDVAIYINEAELILGQSREEKLKTLLEDIEIFSKDLEAVNMNEQDTINKLDNIIDTEKAASAKYANQIISLQREFKSEKSSELNIKFSEKLIGYNSKLTELKRKLSEVKQVIEQKQPQEQKQNTIKQENVNDQDIINALMSLREDIDKFLHSASAQTTENSRVVDYFNELSKTLATSINAMDKVKDKKELVNYFIKKISGSDILYRSNGSNNTEFDKRHAILTAALIQHKEILEQLYEKSSSENTSAPVKESDIILLPQNEPEIKTEEVTLTESDFVTPDEEYVNIIKDLQNILDKQIQQVATGPIMLKAKNIFEELNTKVKEIKVDGDLSQNIDNAIKTLEEEKKKYVKSIYRTGSPQYKKSTSEVNSAIDHSLNNLKMLKSKQPIDTKKAESNELVQPSEISPVTAATYAPKKTEVTVGALPPLNMEKPEEIQIPLGEMPPDTLPNLPPPSSLPNLPTASDIRGRYTIPDNRGRYTIPENVPPPQPQPQTPLGPPAIPSVRPFTSAAPRPNTEQTPDAPQTPLIGPTPPPYTPGLATVNRTPTKAGATVPRGLSKPVSQLLREIAQRDLQLNQTHTDCIYNLPSDKWYYENKKYYRIDKNGKNEHLITKENSCDALGLDDPKCEELGNILKMYNDKEGQMTALKAFVKNVSNKDILKLTAATLKNIHPRYVLYILHAFDFKLNTITKEITSVDNWIRNTLPKYFENNKATMNEFIIQNGRLLDLLACLVNFINANPGIMKHEMYYSQDEYLNRVQEGLPDKIIDDKVYSIRFDNRAQAMKYFGNNNQPSGNSSLLRFLINGPNISGIQIPGPSGFGQYGGGVVMNNGNVQVGGMYKMQVGGFNNKNKACGSKYARKMYIKFKEELKAHGKKLADNDDVNFNKMLNNLALYEDQIHTYLSNIHDYVQTNKEYSTNQEIVTQQQMQEYIKNYNYYNKKYVGQENKVIRALHKIASYADDSQGHGYNFSRDREIPL